MIPERTLQYIYELQFASKLLNINLLEGKGKRALDVGCGKGYGLLALKALGYDVYGYDINTDNVKFCKMLGFKNVCTFNLENGIPFKEDFHLITCFDVLEHVKSLEKALKNLLLANYKYLIITVPNLHTEFIRLMYLTIQKKTLPSFIKGRGFLLRDPDHVNMYGPYMWYCKVGRTLTYLNVKCSIKVSNYFMISLTPTLGKCIILRVPYIGSSTMIAVVRESCV